jgi:hypothetical protein
MAMIGSITHWTFRGLISFLFEKTGIEAHESVHRFLAYVATGALLVGLGIWGHLWWWTFHS